MGISNVLKPKPLSPAQKRELEAMTIQERKEFMANKLETIYMLYSFKSINTYISTHIKVRNKDWDKAKRQVKKSHRGYIKTNDYLSVMKTRLASIHMDLIVANILPETVIVKEKWKELYSLKSQNDEEENTDKEENGFFAQREEFWAFKSGRVSKNTMKGYHSMFKRVQAFVENTGRETSWDKINLEFHQDLEDHLLYDLKYGLNTVGSTTKDYKTYLAWANKRGYLLNDHYKSLKKQRATTQILYLTKEEVFQFYLYKFQSDTHTKVRDAFVLSCVTGLRYSDYSRIEPCNVVGNHIVMISQKTREEIRVPITDLAREILNKYRNHISLPCLQRTNKLLKEAAKEAGLNNLRSIQINKSIGDPKTTQRPINQLITTHLGRKSFTTCLLFEGMSPIEVRRVSHHRDTVSFEKYAGSSEARIAEQMNDTWRLPS